MPEVLTPAQQLADAANRLVNASADAKNRDIQSDTGDSDAYTILLEKYTALQNEYAQYKTDMELLIVDTLNKTNNSINLLTQIN